MMIETQALDLYLRFAQKSVAEAVRAVLYRLADEEKAHLKALGRYRDQWQETAPETP
jgi:rubrerythrin